MGPQNHKWWIAGILLLTAILRFWDIGEVPFHYDELSAVFRAQAPTWSAHWRTGVLPDGHPPGMQMLLWCWVQLFGNNAPLLHSLMALVSLLSVYLVFRTATNLTTPEKAIAVMALYSISFLPLVWGNQIRPYALGMLFCNAYTWQWSRLWTTATKAKWPYIMLGALGGLCAWMHYFAALMVLALWLAAIIHQRGAFRYWLLSALTSALIFAPAVPVFVHQLSFGGLEWLGKPGLDFFLHHLQYLLNGMLFPILAASLIVFLFKPNNKTDMRLAYLFLGLFMLPIIIGFAWSWLHKPVLQHTVLLFSAPFFYLGFISIMPENKLRIIGFSALACMVFGLYQGRYFTDIQKDVYLEQANVLKSHCGLKQILLADGPEDVLMYHLFNKHAVCLPKFISHSQIPFSYSRLWNMWKEWPLKNNPIVLAVNSGSHPGIIPLLEHWTGREARHQYFIGGEMVYLNESATNTKVEYQTRLIETNKSFDISLENTGYQKNDLLVIKVRDSALAMDAELIGSLHNGNRQIDWRNARKQDFAGIADGSLFLFIKTADIPGVNPKTRLSILLKNNKPGEKTKIQYRLSNANPMMYGPEWFQ